MKRRLMFATLSLSLLLATGAFLTRPQAASAFVEETRAVLRNWQLADTGYWLPADFAGEWLNVSGGFRRTVGQPANAAHTVYLFGSSTIFNNEVPDEQTVASQLQALTRDKVVNVGMIPGSVTLLTARLKTLPLRPGDVAIFYVGAAEAADVQIRLKRGDRLDDVIQQVRDSSVRAVREADAYARSHGAALVVLLGTHLWSKPLSPHDEALTRNGDIIGEGVQAVTLATWAMWRTIIPAAHDLTHVLDNAGDVYYNATHVNGRGNEAVARAIYDQLTVF